MNDRARDSSPGPSPESAGRGSSLAGADSPGRAGRVRRDKEEDLALVGKEIAGKYRVLRVLGQGGFGSVFLVEMLSGIVGEKLAMKVLPRAFSASSELRDQFLNEIRVAMKMVTKYIVQIRDVGVTEDGLLYYTMDYVDGKSLSAILHEQGKLPVQRAVRIVMRVLKALNTAHAAGIIHRDLKPANIMVEEEAGDDTKVLDFGIATAIKSEPDRQKGFAGSPHYMPPEQFLATELGFYTDVYSAGVILYECLTGERPHKGATAQEIYASLKSGPPPRVDELRPEVREHAGLAEAVHKAIERNPEKRFPSARAFHERLAMVLRGEAPPEDAGEDAGEAAIAAPAAGVSGRTRARRIGARRKAAPSSSLAALTALLLVTAVGLTAFFLSRKTEEPSGEKPEVARDDTRDPEPDARSRGPDAGAGAIRRSPPAGEDAGTAGEDAGTAGEDAGTPAADAGPETVTDPRLVEPVDAGEETTGKPEPEEDDATRRERLGENLEAARQAASKGDWNAVFRYACEEALDADPQHKEALFLCARSSYELGSPAQVSQAIQTLEDLRRIDPRWRKVETILLLADCRLRQQAPDYEKIVELLESAREAAPGSIEVVTRLAKVYPHTRPQRDLIALLEDARSRGLRTEELDSLYREIVEEPRKRRREEFQSFLARARKAHSERKWTEAVALAEEAVRRDPSSACAYFILADACGKTGELDRADRAAEELARRAEGETTARERCGDVIPRGSLSRWSLLFSGRNAYLRHVEDGDDKRLDEARSRLAKALDDLEARETPELFALARTYHGCVLARSVPDPAVALAEVQKEFYPTRHVDQPEVVWRQSEAYFAVAKRLPVEPYEVWKAREEAIAALKKSYRAKLKERALSDRSRTRARLSKEAEKIKEELRKLADEKRAQDLIRDVQTTAFDLAAKRINDLLRTTGDGDLERRGNVFLGRVYLAWGRSSGIHSHLASAANRFKRAVDAGEKSPEVLELWAESFSLRDAHSQAGALYEQAYRLEPSVERCLLAADSYLEIPARYKARQVLEEGRTRFPGDDRLSSKLAEAEE